MVDILQDIITVVATFSAAIVGIVGNTWNKNKKGIMKLTITGWIAVTLAFLGLYSTVQQSIDKHKRIITLE